VQNQKEESNAKAQNESTFNWDDLKESDKKLQILGRLEDDLKIPSNQRLTYHYINKYYPALDVSYFDNRIILRIQELSFQLQNQKEESKAQIYKPDSQPAQSMGQGQQAEPAPAAAAQGQNVYVDQIPGGTQNTIQNHYTKEQFRQIQLGRKHHLDVSHYWDIKLSSEQMKQLRLMLEQGININQYGYNHPSVPADVLQDRRKLRLCLPAVFLRRTALQAQACLLFPLRKFSVFL